MAVWFIGMVILHYTTSTYSPGKPYVQFLLKSYIAVINRYYMAARKSTLEYSQQITQPQMAFGMIIMFKLITNVLFFFFF